MAGARITSGQLINVSVDGFYWSSTVSGSNARFLDFFSDNAGMNTDRRAIGASVRCIKD